MNHHDLSADQARRLLSIGDAPTPAEWNRRRFLQALGIGVGGGVALGAMDVPWLNDARAAFASPPIGADDRILVTVMLYGGKDGLNTVVPYTNSLYYSQRPRLAIPADQVLRLDGTFGLHPSLVNTHRLWSDGWVGIVHGSGVPFVGGRPELSHFSAMGTWMHGHYGGGPVGTGWIGRWLDGLSPEAAELGAATIGSSLPMHMVGARHRAVAVPDKGGMFGSGSEPHERRMYDGLRRMGGASGRGALHEAYAATLAVELGVAAQVAPAYSTPASGSQLANRMALAARLLNANVGLRVVDVGRGGFDHHDNQPWQLTALLKEFDDGLAAFYATLDPALHAKVTIVTMSEFGRTGSDNDSGGTDHGTSNVQFVIGPAVRGGHYGSAPSLAVADKWTRMVPTVDFRSVYGTLIDRWLGGGASTVLGASHTDLDFFRARPTPGGPLPPEVPSPATNGFVAVQPVRLLDTRIGVGVRQGPVAADESIHLGLGGEQGIPPEATAVALNVTAVGASEATFVTVYPSDVTRPEASNLNPVPGSVVANLTLARRGGDGGIRLYNYAGHVDLVADMVGYYTPAATLPNAALPPDRLMDTRTGLGGHHGLVGAQRLTLQVAGRGGVPADPGFVVLNVVAVQSSEPSFLTVWPSGSERPGTSSLNTFSPGQTIANMVMTGVGADGCVQIENVFGTMHVVVDVLGCGGLGGGRLVAVSPTRLMDSRIGLGIPRRVSAGQRATLRVAGVGPVPAAGVSAVLMNVTAVEPSQPTHVTVFPSGGAEPPSSNINLDFAGMVQPNMVLVPIGAGGGVDFSTGFGSIDLVADVVGFIVG